MVCLFVFKAKVRIHGWKCGKSAKTWHAWEIFWAPKNELTQYSVRTSKWGIQDERERDYTAKFTVTRVTCTCVYMCVYIYIYIIHIYIYINMCVYVHTCIYIYTYIYIYNCVCMYNLVDSGVYHHNVGENHVILAQKCKTQSSLWPWMRTFFNGFGSRKQLYSMDCLTPETPKQSKHIISYYHRIIYQFQLSMVVSEVSWQMFLKIWWHVAWARYNNVARARTITRTIPRKVRRRCAGGTWQIDPLRLCPIVMSAIRNQIPFGFTDVYGICMYIYIIHYNIS